MKIMLIRHGEPQFNAGRVAAKKIPTLLKHYNQAPLVSESQPPDAVKTMARQFRYVVCSDLIRSAESAGRLGLQEIHCQSENFREVALPHLVAGSWPQLKPYSWFLLFRLMWWLGFSNNGESVGTAKKRASYCVDLLIQSSQENGSVIFVGHGLLNHYMAKELMRRGWEGPKSPGREYWDYGIYHAP